MPNPANVEAIKAILDEVVEAMRKAAPPNVLVGEYATDFLAECLAARGVLVISDAVLTDEACLSLYDGREYHTPERVRRLLAQLAKGE